MSTLLLTGNSGAGKSTLAHNLRLRYNGVHIMEREISRDIATAAGFGRSRNWVEAVGITAAATAIRKQTIELLYQNRDNRLAIVDGAYDRKLPEAIRQEFPASALGIIAVEAKFQTRVDRYAGRLGGIALRQALEDVKYLDHIKQAVGADELLGVADLRIVNDQSLGDMIGQATDFIDTWL